MLYSNTDCQGINKMLADFQTQHFIEQIKKGSNISLLVTFDDLLNGNAGIKQLYAESAFRVLAMTGMLSAKNFSSHQNQLAYYGFAMSNLFYVFNTTNNSLSLHTSSISILERLRKSGCITTKDNEPIEYAMGRWNEQLNVSGGGLSRSLSTVNQLRTVRLDEKDGKYVTVIPRSCVDIYSDILIPEVAMSTCIRGLLTLCSSQLVKIQSGDKIRYITTNPDILKSAYGESRANFLIRSVRQSNTWVYIPSVGESRYTPGLTRIEPAFVDCISGASINEVDLSRVNINYDFAREFLKSKLTDKNASAICLALTGRDLSRFENPKGLSKSNQVVEFLNHTYEAVIYDVIVKMGYDLDEYNAFNNCYTDVEVPKTSQQMYARLDADMYKVIYVKVDGKFKVEMLTNSNAVLKKIYGRDYIKNMESDGVKLGIITKYILNTKTLMSEDLILTCNKYGLYKLAGRVKYMYALENTQVNKELVLSIVDHMTNEINDSHKTYKKDSNIVTARNCKAALEPDLSSKDYYKNIDITRIVSMQKVNV